MKRFAALALAATFGLGAVTFLAFRYAPATTPPTPTALPGPTTSAVATTPSRPTVRAMPRVAMPLDFALPNGCALSQGGAAVQTGENGSLIHWIALCPDTDPADMPQLFASASAKQGWVTATAPAAHFDAYRRGDLELLLEFTATNYVWFGERYWR